MKIGTRGRMTRRMEKRGEKREEGILGLEIAILMAILVVAIGLASVGCVGSTAGTDYECGDNNTAMAGNVSETGEVAGGSTAYFGGGIRLECKKTNHWIVEHNNVHDNYGPGIFVRGDENVIRYNDVTGSENASDVASGCAVGVGYGIYFCGVYNSITANTFCENAGFIDIRDDVGSNFGDENTCDCTHDYDDEGTTGCSYDCSPAADLVIVNKTEEWVVEGSSYNVIYTVKNTGDANANASTTSITIDGAEETTDSVPELAAGASHTTAVGPFSMSGTNDTIRVCADKDNVVSEKSKEYNNCLENLFTVEDTIPPGSISNLTSTTGNFWINWTWTNPSDEDFNYTMVYLNGTWETNTSTEYYNATGLIPATNYTISTLTVDKVGNINTTWINLTTKTQAEATPTVSISTDKKEYHPGDIMNVTIHLQNPTETAHQLILAWYLILPDSEDRKEIMFTKITLPPGFDESFSMPLRIKYWAAIEFNATWHTALLDGTTYEIISEDKADWRYVPVKMKKH